MLSGSWGTCMPIRNSMTNEVEWDICYYVVRRAPFGLVCQHHHPPRCYYERDFLLDDMMWWHDLPLPTFVSMIKKTEPRREAGCSLPKQQNFENSLSSFSWVWFNFKVTRLTIRTQRCTYTHVTQKKKTQGSKVHTNKTCKHRKPMEVLQGYSAYTQTRKHPEISTSIHPYFASLPLSCRCRSNGHATQTKAKKSVEVRVIINKHSFAYGLTPLSQAVSFWHKISRVFGGLSEEEFHGSGIAFRPVSGNDGFFYIMTWAPNLFPDCCGLLCVCMRKSPLINDELVSHQHSSAAAGST